MVKIKTKIKQNKQQKWLIPLIGKLNEMIQTIRLNIPKNIIYKEKTILPEFILII